MKYKISALTILLVVVIEACAQTAAPVSQAVSTSALAATQEAVIEKRLKRRTHALGPVDDHACTLERNDREEDYLAALTKQEIAGYLKLASAGDADAMYLLALIPGETAVPKPEGIREYPWRDPWLARAGAAGHPIAKYLLAAEAHDKKLIADGDYLALVEAAALAQGSGDIAWRLAFSYMNPDAEKGDVRYKVPRNFMFLSGDKAKALYWARLAAGKGNMMAAEDLCSTMYLGTAQYKYGIQVTDTAETARWCTLAAQAGCSERAALSLSGLYQKGIGVTRSMVDALYWRKISDERNRRNFLPIGKWKYRGGANDK